jgi:hypothetical protein
VPVPNENAFPYGRFRSRNIKNDYAAERHVTDGKTSEFIYKMSLLYGLVPLKEGIGGSKEAQRQDENRVTLQISLIS